MRARRPSLVDFQAPLNPRLDGRLVAHLSRQRPVVWTAHDPVPLDGSQAEREGYAAIYRAADAVVAHSSQAAAQIEALAGVEPTVLELIGPTGLVRTESAQARRSLGLPAAERIVVAPGFIRSYKGYSLLADTWERLGSRAPLLLVVGELVDEREREAVDRLARSGRAEVRLGFASDDELRLAYCAADAILLPHLQASDSGLLDMAGALGVPVIASDVPALAEAIAARGGGRVLAREPALWADAVTGELPDPPPGPQAQAAPGDARRAVYERVLHRRGSMGAARSGGARSRALVAYTDATETGGAELGLATLLAGLSERHRVTVMASDEAVGRWICSRRADARLELVPPVRGKWDLLPILAHLRAIRRLAPDVFHANLRIPWADQYGLAAALWARTGAVIAVEQLITPTTSALQRRLKLATSTFLDGHVAVGERLAREIEGEVGLPRGAIGSIHNSVAEREVEAHERPAAGPVIGTLARLAPEKRLDLIVRGLERLPDATAVIVGDGEERARLESLAAELGVAERLLITGWTDEPLPWLGAFDLFVLPSDFEGLPHAIVEAMLAGLAVVATDVGSVGEAVVDGETGVLVPAGDLEALVAAVARLLDDAELRERMGAAGRERARERFAPRAMVAAYERLYDEVTG